MNDQTVDATAILEELTRAVQGRYVVGDVLGFGRGGVTVRARKVVSGDDVALKVAWTNANALAQVMRESVLTMKAPHPHVVPMERVDIAGGNMLVVEMPLATGTVDDLIEPGVPVPFASVAEIMSQAAAALDAAHENGIVHGGLRPVKLLLDARGQCLVTDFGLRIPPVSGRDVTQPSTLGAAGYTPVEQRHDSPDVDARIDQFALAVIAYELLRGRRTWTVNADGVIEIEAIELMAGRPIAPGVPIGASLAIRRATSREAGFRYASVGEFVRALSEASAHPIGHEHIHRATVPVEQRRSAAWMILPIACLVVAALALQPSIRNGTTQWWRSHWSPAVPKLGDTDIEIDPSVPLVEPGASGRSDASKDAPPATTAASNRRDTTESRAGGDRSPVTIHIAAPPPARRSDSRFAETPPPSRETPASSAPTNTRYADPSPTGASTTRVGPSASSGTLGTSSRTPGNPSIAAAVATQSGSAARSSAPVRPTVDNTAGVVSVSIRGRTTSDVFIDGHNRGRTPLVWAAAPGRHIVALRDSSGYSPSTTTVSVRAGDTTHVVFTPTRRP